MSFGFGVGDFIAVLDKAKLYRERFADAPDHFDSLSREIESLASILEYIGSVEEQLEDTEKEQLAPAIKESVKLLGELEKIHNENTSLDRSLSTTKLAALKPRAIWSRLRLKPEDVQKLRLRISLNVAFLGAIKGFRDSEAIHATKRVVVSMHDDQSSRQRREILDWLTMTDYASQQRDHLSRRHAGTNEWLLDSEEFKSWISGKSKTLLCPGMPGAGKTVMASTVVDELLRQFQDDPDVGVAYIYCNFKDQERQNHHDLIASLAKQLAQSRSSMPRSLKEMYEIHQMSRTPMSLQETSDLLQAIASSYRRLFVIIDALDECETKSRRALLSEVFRLQQRQNTNILATTRQIPEIIDSDHFKGSVSVQVSALDADVSRYISSRIPDMQSFVQKRSELQEEIKRGILGSINGMFLMAKLLIESLSCKTNVKAIRKTLIAVTTEDHSYAYFYEEALERIRVQPPAHVELANEVLSWIVFSRRPLKVLELQHALAFEEGEPEVDEDNISPAEMIISACAGLVTLDDDGGTIRLVHQTTQEFFNKRKANLFPGANAGIARTCVRYLCLDQIHQLSRDSHWDIPPWRSPLFLKFATSKMFRNTFIPFYDYATMYWGDHAREAGELPAGVHEFLSNQVMFKINIGILKELVGEQVPSTGAHLAAWFGLTTVFETQISSARDHDFVDWKGQTSLSWAARRGHLIFVEFLLNYSDKRQNVLLLEANSNCGKGPGRSSKDSISFQQALREAVNRGHRAMVDVLVKFGVDRGLRLENDTTSLLGLCIGRADVEVMNVLLAHEQRTTSESTEVLDATKRRIDLEKRDAFMMTPLAIASSIGLTAAVEILLEYHVNVEPRDINGRTPLFLAAEQDHTSSLRQLLEHGAETEARDEKSRTPLLVAAVNGHVSSTRILLEHGANIEASDKDDNTPLLVAAAKGNTFLLKLILEFGAETEAWNSDQKTPLILAVAKNHAHSVDLLLKHGANTEAIDKDNNTPLLVAAANDDTLLMGLLLEHGAEIEAWNSDQETPLALAVAKINTRSVEFLLKHGADIEYRDSRGRTPLLAAAEHRHTSRVVETLLGYRADITSRDHAGRNALMCAIVDVDTFSTCLKYGFDIEDRNLEGRTVLSLIASYGLSHTMEELLQHNANIESRDHKGWTPLWHAVASHNLSCVRTLIDHGADIESRGDDEETPLIRAAARGDADIISTLLNGGACIEACDRFGRTALLAACQRPNPWRRGPEYRAWAMLLAHGADPTARDHQGRTPLWWAISSGKFKAIRRLSSVTSEVEARDIDGISPLIPVVLLGNEVCRRIIQWLLCHVSGFGTENDLSNKERFPVTTEKALAYVQSLLGSDLTGLEKNMKTSRTQEFMGREAEDMARERNRLVGYLNSTNDEGLKELWAATKLGRHRYKRSNTPYYSSDEEISPLDGAKRWSNTLTSKHKYMLIQAIHVDDENLFNHLLGDEKANLEEMYDSESDLDLDYEEMEQNPLVSALEYGRMSMLQGLVNIGAEIGILLNIDGMDKALDRLIGQ